MRTIIALLLFTSPVFADDREEARRHFGAGVACYSEGRFAEAVGEFEAANAITPSPLLDFNIARALDRLGRWEAAITRYEQYLRSFPPDAKEVRERVVDLQGRLTIPQLTMPAVAAPAPKPAFRWKAPTSVAAVSLGFAIIGTGLLGSAVHDYGGLTCAPNCMPSQWGGIQAREYSGEALLGIAAGLVVVDVVLWVVAKRKAGAR